MERPAQMVMPHDRLPSSAVGAPGMGQGHRATAAELSSPMLSGSTCMSRWLLPGLWPFSHMLLACGVKRLPPS